MKRILVVLIILIDTDRKCKISFLLPPHLHEQRGKKNHYTLGTEENHSCLELFFYPERSKYFSGIYARLISASQMEYVKQILVTCLAALHQRNVKILILAV